MRLFSFLLMLGFLFWSPLLWAGGAWVARPPQISKIFDGKVGVCNEQRQTSFAYLPVGVDLVPSGETLAFKMRMVSLTCQDVNGFPTWLPHPPQSEILRQSSTGEPYSLQFSSMKLVLTNAWSRPVASVPVLNSPFQNLELSFRPQDLLSVPTMRLLQEGRAVKVQLEFFLSSVVTIESRGHVLDRRLQAGGAYQLRFQLQLEPESQSWRIQDLQMQSSGGH